jgi:hypothetical protein
MKIKALALLAFMAGCTPVMAQETPQCWERENFLQIIESHKAWNGGYGLNQNMLLVEVWVRPDREWLITFTSPNMVTCVVTWGIGWQEGHMPPQGEEG